MRVHARVFWSVSVVLLTACGFQPARADGPLSWWHQQTRRYAVRRTSSATEATGQAVRRQFQGRPIRRTSPTITRGPVVLPIGGARPPTVPADRPPQRPPNVGYARLSAPLYPCPVQNIPVQVGGVVITNPALAPHEMLYAHEYRSLYPPFYYKVKGGWLWTPFGIESHDKWELQGTEIRVKYMSRRNLFRQLATPFLK